MSALATCTVNRISSQFNIEDNDRLGLLPTESSFEATILYFDNMYAYVVKDTAKTLHLAKLKEISNIVPIP